jgi:hypothetical protein
VFDDKRAAFHGRRDGNDANSHYSMLLIAR